MAATVQARIFTGASEGTGASAEGGVVFNREDTATGTTAVPKPTATGTNYSWYKNLGLYVTAGGGSTSISNRKIRMATAPSTGLTLHFKDGTTTYTQAASGNKPTDDAAANDATPSTYTAMTTSFQTWDAASAAATNTTRNGNFVKVIGGVANNYAGGAGAGIALPNLELQYDEA